MARWLKRLLDLEVALLGLVLLSPLLAVLAVSVWMDVGRPILFVHVRPGLGGAGFRLFKFRTMSLATDDAGQLLPNDQRLTVLGRWLRRTSLDELPELWNVLRGDMSLVGPRPLLTEYLEAYTDVERLRHDVRPGITGLAQVRGRNSVSWDAKMAADVEYVETWSLTLDARILAQTAAKVITARDVVAGGSEQRPPEDRHRRDRVEAS